MGKSVTLDAAVDTATRPSRGRNLKSMIADVIDAIAAGREAHRDYRRQIAHGVEHKEAVKTVLHH